MGEASGVGVTRVFLTNIGERVADPELGFLLAAARNHLQMSPLITASLVLEAF